MTQMQFPHKLVLTERSQLTMTGVTEVVSFDDTTVILHTELGTLEIQGDGLQLKNLSLEGGQVAVEGNICALLYDDPHPAGSLWGRLFK